MKKIFNKPLSLVAIAFTLFGWQSPLNGADSPKSWTIDQLVQQALARNAELKFYEAEVMAARGQRTQAGLWKNPEISGEYGSHRVKDESGAVENGYTYGVAITQPFEFPGKGSLRKAIANKEIELAELGLEQFRLTLAGRIRSLAYQYLGSIINTTTAEEINERSTGLIKLLQERPVAGAQQLLELRIIEGSLIELQNSYKDFLLQREEARLELNNLIGWPANQPLTIKKTDLSPPTQKLKLNDLVMAGLNRNLQLKIRVVELEKAVKEVSSAKLAVAPDFSIGPFFSQDHAGETEENFGGTISFTLPLWDWNQGNVATAKARKQQADASLLEARRKVENEISRRLRIYELNQKQLEQSPHDSVTKLREASDLADRQYRTGVINIQLFLEMQRGFLSAQQVYNETLSETWQNLLDLDLLTGGSLQMIRRTQK
jgi:cobalt-zinc-cadmium efflux system outer membrane protein